MPRITSQKLFQERIARRIQEVLDERGWKQQELVIRTGLPKSYISKIMQANANLTLETIVRLSDALKIDLIAIRRKS